MTRVATFEVCYTQYLDSAGQLVQNLPAFAENTETLIRLYRVMALMRLFDAKAIALQRTGKMGTYASILGQEAIDTALGDVMQPDDVLCPFYRNYAAQYQRQVKLSEILTYWGGDERGNCFANNATDLPISVPIASQCLHAAGAAYAFKYRQQSRVAVACCGDGGTSEGDFYEAINVTGAWQLPVVFIINNNQWAISVPRAIQTAASTIAQKGIAAGLWVEQVDGNDVIACYDVFEKALARARRGEGGSVIEAITYRLCDHTTADDASRYRDQSELEKAWQNEPIKRLKIYLERVAHWDEAKESALQKDCEQEVAEAVQQYVERTPQSVESIFDYMYEQWPENLKEQRDDALMWEGKEHA